MQLIKKIEINYLRSLYGAVLTNTGDLNIVFGRNDSGKSNLLRALSLFFNGELEPDQTLDFLVDLSDIRREEARNAKGRQAIWIKVTLNVPPNFRNSLGTEVTIKRQWNRDREMTETIWPTTLSGAKSAQLTKLRNQIDFTYIPAVKDLDVYADLIERMYGAAAESTVLQSATSEFVNAIQSQTTDLSDELTNLFESPARLAAPTEMSRLFRTLDFAHGDEGHSLLRQKGDGVKARHLPELLRYINQTERSKKWFIWGFEEPENSLDLSAAEAQARRFAEFSARPDTQVFITSHSPAFYLADSDNKRTSLRKFFIAKQRPDQNTGYVTPSNAASAIDDIDDAEKQMDDAGLLQLPYAIRRLSKLKTEIDTLERERARLKDRLAHLQIPALFVEGTHDVGLFRTALNRQGIEQNVIDVTSLGGTPKSAAALLRAITNSGKAIGSAPSFFLFDNDKAGRQAYKAICGEKPTNQPLQLTPQVFVWVLPMSELFIDFLNRWDIPPDKALYTAEFLFPAGAGAALCLELLNEYKVTNPRALAAWEEEIHGDYFHGLRQQTVLGLAQASPGTVDWLFAKGVPDELKRDFSERASEALSTDEVDSISALAGR